MAAISNSYHFALGPALFVSNVYAALTTSSSAIPANGTYLVLCRAIVGGTSSNARVQYRLLHGATVFTDSEMIVEPAKNTGAAVNREQVYTYMTVYVASSGAEDIILQGRRGSGIASRGHGLEMGIQVIRLDADLTENTDWYFNENTTDQTTNSVFKQGAQVTVAAATAGNWLVIGNVNYDVDSSTSSFEIRLNRDSGAEVSPLSRREGENEATEVLTSTCIWSYNLTVGSHPIALEYRNDTGIVKFNHRSSRIFALRLDAFNEHAVDVQPGILGSGSDVQLGSVALSPSVTSDYLYLGQTATTNDDAGQVLTTLWLDEDGTKLPDTNSSTKFSAVTYDNTDLANTQTFARRNLANGASSYTVQLRAAAAGALDFWQDRCLVAFSMELASGAAPQLVEVEAASLTATGVEPGFSFGNINVAVEVASLTGFAPALTAGLGNLNVVVEAASLTATGVEPTTSSSLDVAVEAASLTLSAPSFTVVLTAGDVTILVEAASLALAAPALTVSLGNIDIAVEAASLTAAGQELDVALLIAVEAASITATGIEPDFGFGNINVAVAAASLTLQAPVIAVSAGALEDLVFFHVERVNVNTADYPTGTTFKFQVVVGQDSVTTTVIARLRNVTTGLDVTGSELTTTNTAPTLLESGNLTLPSGTNLYRAVFGGAAGGEYRCYMARIRAESD